MRHANKDAEAMDDLAVAVFRQKLRSLATYTFSTAQLLLRDCDADPLSPPTAPFSTHRRLNQELALPPKAYDDSRVCLCGLDFPFCCDLASRTHAKSDEL